jgi:hypothetical protein
MFTDWRTWGVGISFDLDFGITLEFGPWTIEIEWLSPYTKLPPELRAKVDAWSTRVKADPSAAGTQEFLDFARSLRRLTNG